tara:strand:- start:1131 stop:2582 length:1452 start_codon:yes stop_codon:yes gene_type:complete
MSNEEFKISLLVLATSKQRDEWKSIKDSYLYNMTLKTFLLTLNKEHKYVVYIGIDKNDRIFDNLEEQEVILKFSKVFPFVEIIFITMENIEKGHVTLMWNILFKHAYNNNCDYFYQCGDDMEFKTNGWINACIEKLKENKNVGLAGPINNNNRILTQAFVSRKHMEIFGFFFPKEIKNWCCDDWYNMVYYPKYLYPLQNHLCINNGGQPRYDIHNIPNFTGNGNRLIFQNNTIKLRNETQQLANYHKKILEKYIEENNLMETLGTNYGGWSIPINCKLDENSIIYSGGVGEDISFDLKINNKYKSNIILIDPTKRALKHFEEVKTYYATKKNTFSGDIQPDYLNNIQNLNPDFGKFMYINKGLYREKSVLKFYKQTNPQYVSQSLVDNMFGNDYDEVDSIKNIMSDLNHTKIDLLKLDIEGSEIDVLNQMLDDKIYPKYLCIEFDLLLKRKDPNKLTQKLVNRLQENNYKILEIKDLNITFER